jgi:hypothetical protein
MPYVEKIFAMSELCDGPQLVEEQDVEYMTAPSRCQSTMRDFLDCGRGICQLVVPHQLRKIAVRIRGLVLLGDLRNILQDSQLVSMLFLRRPRKISIPWFFFHHDD